MAKKNSLSEAMAKHKDPAKKSPNGKGTPDTIAARNSGTALIAGHFDRSVQRQLKIMAAEGGTTVQALLEKALNMLFADHGKPQIADTPRVAAVTEGAAANA